MRKIIAKWLAARVVGKLRKVNAHPWESQEKVFLELIKKGKNTQFGKAHNFDKIKNFQDYKEQVPVRDYEELKDWFIKTKDGEEDVLWPGKPIYLAKTSGTTSGTKYIPITRDSISNHINGAKHALFCYIHETGRAKFTEGKMIFLQGSPELENVNGIKTGRLSGIVAHHVPSYLQKNRQPSFEVNCIEDWEEKVDAIARETLDKRMTLISGIPPWVQMYFEKLISISGKKTIREIFPDFSLFVYGGVNYEPYRAKMEAAIGKKIDSVETYPASEGFIAYQDTQTEQGLLLQLDQGLFYEFIPVTELGKDNPMRLTVKEVETGVNYAIVLTSNAGLWSYLLGDTVKFVSLTPPRILVTGRIKHFTSAFGEHVIAEEVEGALNETIKKFPATVAEFHVAPQVKPETGLPFHEWLIAFEKIPENMEAFASELDLQLRKRNSYYDDLITGKVIQPLKVSILPSDAFILFMKQRGKLGGQNKVPRLANDREAADELLKTKH